MQNPIKSFMKTKQQQLKTYVWSPVYVVRDCSGVMTAACLPPPRKRFRCRSGHRMSLNPVHTSDHNT